MLCMDHGRLQRYAFNIFMPGYDINLSVIGVIGQI